MDDHGLLAAEERLFEKLGLEHRSRRVPLVGGPVEQARVLETGDGPPLLLVHGAGMGAALWAPLLVHLPDRRCIAVDLPGCGLTDPFDYRGVDLREHAQAFLQTLNAALGLDQPPVVASSLGATYCLYAAAVDEGRFSHLVLLGATGVALPGGRGNLAMALYSRPALGGLLSAMSPPVRPRLARRMLRGICGAPAVGAMPDEMVEAVAAMMRRSEPTTRSLTPMLFVGRTPRPHLALDDDELARVTPPTRFVWGRDDRFQSVEAGRRAAAVMPAADVIEVEGGHHPWWDDPARCAELIRNHIAG